MKTRAVWGKRPQLRLLRVLNPLRWLSWSWYLCPSPAPPPTCAPHPHSRPRIHTPQLGRPAPARVHACVHGERVRAGACVPVRLGVVGASGLRVRGLAGRCISSTTYASTQHSAASWSARRRSRRISCKRSTGPAASAFKPFSTALGRPGAPCTRQGACGKRRGGRWTRSFRAGAWRDAP